VKRSLLAAVLAATTASAGPPVQVLVPGFAVRELPVALANVNNLKYRPDGKLLALGYDGNVWLLSDTDGDGLEDKADPFWANDGTVKAPLAMAVTPEGVYVTANRKVILIRDGKAETVVAGWPDSFAYTGGAVDALGVAVDRENNLFFAVGTPNFTNGYVVKDGKARFDPAGERGTVLKVSPDRKTREVYAAGVRFGVALAFNRHGDLFGTDQEGATWLPNGNPFDELLHIQKGRYYGFPPRHPAHLPGVIDEPSVFDYGPQHQSTCGLTFNESVNGGPAFGPKEWAGDAIVAGYSRGKLYRTALVKTPAGYVARNQILAGLNMLTVDACVSPAGGLVVACHGGGPDWGTGPSGKGKLFKVEYTGRDLAQPVAAWPQSPTEVRVAFDRPLTPAQAAGLGVGGGIEFGRAVAAGDRFETVRPGYKAVQDQLRQPRTPLPVRAARVADDRRTVVLTTDPHPEAVGYALTLPGLGRPLGPDAKRGELPQAPATDLAYDLTGVDAAWKSADGSETWAGWLPHPDLGVARPFTAGSAGHDGLWALARRPGTLTLRAALDLRGMLRPAVQPGSQLDHAPAPERVTLTVRSRSPFAVNGATAGPDSDGFAAVVALPDAARVSFEVALTTGGGDPDLRVSWHTAEDGRPRALPLRRVLVPWVPAERPPAPAAAAADAPELAGGNWERGRKLFFGDQAACSRCHTYGGEGGAVGPDLSNLPHRDFASVARDVAEPNYAINPDYVTQVVTLADGRVLTGAVRADGDTLVVGDDKGVQTAVPRAEVEGVRPSRLSVMPEGLPKQLGPDKMRDLLTFLLIDPAQARMPDYGKGPPPPVRPAAEVRAVLAGAPSPPDRVKPLTVVLVAGPKDHGDGEHDYPAWKRAWGRLLGMADGLTASTADGWPSADQLKAADVLVFFQKGTWTPNRAKDLDAFLARGGGAVFVHYAVDGGADPGGFADRIGLAWRGGRSKFRHGPLEVGFDPGHPVARNFDKVRFVDESYWDLVGDPARVARLGWGREGGADRPLFWTREVGPGRVFVSVPGHHSWTFDDPLFRVLLLRGVAWAAREPVDRFNALVAPGARLTP
jgi:putative heme-binding domain-containing protein